jgi:cyclopropane fatty-acyl-phospholipid synthase-like methyltransferase
VSARAVAMEDLVRRLPAGAPLLDVGSGAGDFLARVARSFRAFGVERSPYSRSASGAA